MTRNQALKMVAAHAAAKAIREAEEYDVVGWEDYGEIGENDWDQVSKLLLAVAEKIAPHEQDIADARDLLASFADRS